MQPSVRSSGCRKDEMGAHSSPAGHVPFRTNLRMARVVVLGLAMFAQGVARSGEEKIVDVTMISPYVPLPFSLTSPTNATRFALVTEGRIRQESGAEAEIMTAYRKRDGTWPVWVQLPDQAGEFGFAHGKERVKVVVAPDSGDPHTYGITVHPEGGGRATNSYSKLFARDVRLPIAGAARQVSGPAATIIPGKSTAENAWVRIPGQVCTLIFAFDGTKERAVVRVWADKDNKCFVSRRKGDDANPGTEDRPCKSIQRAVRLIREAAGRGKEPRVRGSVYVSGGEYDLAENGGLTIESEISLFGGFDENGWRRDPIITESVLLPHGFRENWVNDLTDRYKDLRSAEPRYHETILWRSAMQDYRDTIYFGPDEHHLVCSGTPDTYFDGFTVLAPGDELAQDKTDAIGPHGAGGNNKRTFRNNMIINSWAQGHAFMAPTGGDGRFENNLIQGGIVGLEDNVRPQIVGAFRRWHRNLVIGGSGGHYTRMLNLWGEAGTFTENQFHGGESFGWTGMQVDHGAQQAERNFIFRRNLMCFDYLFNPFNGSGVILEGNDIYLFKGGVSGQFLATRALTITNNTFHLAPGIREENLFKSARMTRFLGGRFEADGVYVEPQGGGTGKPIIEKNRFVEVKKEDRRPLNQLLDLAKLGAAIKKTGERACFRPKDPATDLEALVAEDRTVGLTWKPSKDPDVVGYILRYGPEPHSFLNPTLTGNVSTAQVRRLAPGTWYFTVVPVKEANVEGWKLSNEASVVVR